MIWRMRISCWIHKARNAHTDCVTLIAFPQQQWLHEHASVLRYTHIACLVFNHVSRPTHMSYVTTRHDIP